MVDVLGLHPSMAASFEMQSLLDAQVLPMFDVLDSLKNKSSSPAVIKGCSIRNLIGQAQLREVQATELSELLASNNQVAMREAKYQYVFIADAAMAKAVPAYADKARQLVGNSRLTEVQRLNLNLNLQLIEMEKIRFETTEGTNSDDDGFIDDLLE